MRELIDDIKFAALREYDRASGKHGKANNSSHESYAVILEEVEEAEEEADEFRALLEAYWKNVKNNKIPDCAYPVMFERAVRAASEWAQVAAMCYKAAKEKI